MMQMLLRGLILAMALLAGQAYAACSSPAGAAGQTRYASNYSMMVYCDGTNWVSMAGGVSVTIGGTTYNNTPGGVSSSVQFNNGSSFGGDSNFTYSGGLLTLTGGTISTTNVYASAVSTTSLTVNGVAITGNASGDRITSGTLLAVANSATGYISLTTGATNWGYLSSGASFIPTLGANAVSSTNVSASIADFTSTTVTSVAGSGGNYIVSGTTSLSATTNGINAAVNGVTALSLTTTGATVSGTLAASSFAMSYETKSTTSGVGTPVSQQAACTAGKTVIAGGCSDSSNCNVYRSYPTGGNAWQCNSIAISAGSCQLTAYVVCAKVQ